MKKTGIVLSIVGIVGILVLALSYLMCETKAYSIRHDEIAKQTKEYEDKACSIRDVNDTVFGGSTGTDSFKPSAGDYFTGDTSKHEADYLDWLSAAEEGNEWAQCRMGDFCFTGCAGYTNYSEAIKWWFKSAEQGNAVAKYKLIKFYFLENLEQRCKPHPFLHNLLF